MSMALLCRKTTDSQMTSTAELAVVNLKENFWSILVSKANIIIYGDQLGNSISIQMTRR